MSLRVTLRKDKPSSLKVSANPLLSKVTEQCEHVPIAAISELLELLKFLNLIFLKVKESLCPVTNPLVVSYSVVFPLFSENPTIKAPSTNPEAIGASPGRVISSPLPILSAVVTSLNWMAPMRSAIMPDRVFL